MYLKKPTLEEQEELFKLIDEVNQFDGNFEGARNIMDIEDYPAWLEKLKRYEKAETVPLGRVPGITYFAMEEDKIIGVINLRFYLNEALRNHGGHIGYFIRPSERGKGKGTNMLALCLEEAKKYDLDEVMITCRLENIASARVMEKNGAVYERNYTNEEGQVYKNYWIKIEK